MPPGSLIILHLSSKEMPLGTRNKLKAAGEWGELCPLPLALGLWGTAVHRGGLRLSGVGGEAASIQRPAHKGGSLLHTCTCRLGATGLCLPAPQTTAWGLLVGTPCGPAPGSPRTRVQPSVAYCCYRDAGWAGCRTQA